MRKRAAGILFLAAAALLAGEPAADSQKPMTSVHDISVRDMEGKDVSLAEYKGRVLLLVNVASQCGLTPQYAGLERLHRQYKEKGLALLGFPCNDFGGQEPGSKEEIKTFCSSKYDVTFQLFDKLHTKGPEQHPLYQFLTGKASPAGGVSWNFEKFLIARDGAIVSRFKPAVKPDDPELIAALERELAR